MSKIIILYNLKPEVSPEQFETWTRQTDYPTMRGIQRVQSFVTCRTVKNLLSDAKPSVRYVEIFEIPDLAGFISEDMAGEMVQQIMGEFLQYVHNPEFLIAEDVV